MYVLCVFNKDIADGLKLFAGLDPDSELGFKAEDVKTTEKDVRSINAFIYFDYEKANDEAIRYNAIIKVFGRADPQLTPISASEIERFIGGSKEPNTENVATSSVTFFNYHPDDVVKEEHICYYTTQRDGKYQLIEVYKEFVKNKNGDISILMEKIGTRQVKECSVYAVSNSEVFLMMHAQAVCRKLA